MVPDSIVWKSLKSGDQRALAELYQRYVHILYSYGKKITRDEQRIEDCIQDLFVELWQSREKLGDVETARFYLFRSLRRRISRSVVRDHPFTPLTDTIETLVPTNSHEASLILQEDAENATAFLNSLIRELPTRQEEAILMYFYQNFEYHEIAEILVINEQSARNLIQRALGKLREIASSVKSPFTTMFLISFLKLNLISRLGF